jgi:hypothetical protein
MAWNLQHLGSEMIIGNWKARYCPLGQLPTLSQSATLASKERLRSNTLFFGILTWVVSGSPGRPPADANELCRRCSTYHAPDGRIWSGGRRISRCRCLRGAKLSAGASSGCIRANCHRMSVGSPVATSRSVDSCVPGELLAAAARLTHATRGHRCRG